MKNSKRITTYIQTALIFLLSINVANAGSRPAFKDNNQVAPPFNEKFQPKISEGLRDSVIKEANTAVTKAKFNNPRGFYPKLERHHNPSYKTQRIINNIVIDDFPNTYLDPRCGYCIHKNQTCYSHDATANYLFSKIITYPVTAKRGADWRTLPGKQKEFLLANIALPNLGENQKHKSRDTETFTDTNGQFDADKLRESLKEHFTGVFMHAQQQQVQHLVFITETGQGAFTRYAHQYFEVPNYVFQHPSDPQKTDSEIAQAYLEKKIRTAYIEGFIDAWNNLRPSFTVYLVGPEANVSLWNRTLKNNYSNMNLKQKPGSDALMVAQNLANDPHTSGTTMLLNGANNKGPGNGFLTGGARQAMDENFHRRLSDDVIVAVFMMNQGAIGKSRERTVDLRTHIANLQNNLKTRSQPHKAAPQLKQKKGQQKASNQKAPQLNLQKGQQKAKSKKAPQQFKPQQGQQKAKSKKAPQLKAKKGQQQTNKRSHRDNHRVVRR